MKHILTEKVNYHRNRPFLIIDVYYKPAPTIKTHQKKWSKTPGSWRSEEHPYVVNRISDKHIRQATVIVDINNKSLIKNRYIKTSDEEIYQHFASKYALQIKEAKDVWKLREHIIDAETPVEPGITVTMV